MKEYVLKRFGDLTLMNVHSINEPSDIMICEKDKYNESITLNVEELRALYHLYLKNMTYLIVESEDYKFTVECGGIVIESNFGEIQIDSMNLRDLIIYIKEEIKEEV